MVKIARISTQKRNRNRYNIFLDDGQGESYGFSVDEDILIEYNLRKDLEVDKVMMATLVEQDTLHKSYTQVINYLSYRMRTEKEIRDYLVKKEVDHEHITQIVNKLIDKKLIDDGQFANLFVNTRMKTSQKGPALVKKELMMKGVSMKQASQAIEQYGYQVQYEKAFRLAEKRLNQSSKHSFRKQLEQLQAALMRNGFTQEVIKEVMQEFEGQKDVDAEWEALIQHGEKLLRKHQRKLSGYELKNKLKAALYQQGFEIGIIDAVLKKMMEENE